MHSTTTLILIFAMITLFFAFFGLAAARDNPGRLPVSLWIAQGFMFAFPLYMAFTHPRGYALLCSIGAFGVGHLYGVLTNSKVLVQKNDWGPGTRQ